MRAERKIAIAGAGASKRRVISLNRPNIRTSGTGCCVAAVALALALTGCTPASTDSPKTESAPQSLSDAALVQADIDNAWDRTGLPDDQRPDVKIIRYTDLIGGAEAKAACLNLRGWNVTASAGGWGSDDPIPNGQESAYALDAYVCDASYPTDPKYLRPLDEAQRDRAVDYYDNELRACFEEHGQTMTELPSRAKFVQDYYRMTWDAHSSVTAINTPAGSRALEEFRSECSMLPPVDSGVWG